MRLNTNAIVGFVLECVEALFVVGAAAVAVALALIAFGLPGWFIR